MATAQLKVVLEAHLHTPLIAIVIAYAARAPDNAYFYPSPNLRPLIGPAGGTWYRIFV